MLDGLHREGRNDIIIHHVDARFSDNMEEIGSGSLRKIFKVIRFCGQAILIRMRHGPMIFYYVPAPPKLSAIYRDWLVLLLCRPFFSFVVLHWHAVGLGNWAVSSGETGSVNHNARALLTRLLLLRHQRSLVLTEWGREDVAPFKPKEVIVVPNGIPDPCPDFDTTLLTHRRSRRAVLATALAGGSDAVACISYLGHCTAQKGLWDAMAAVALAIVKLRRDHSPLRLLLKVAGEFPSEADRTHFASLKKELETAYQLSDDWVEHIGFVGGVDKRRFFEQADCLCFPTYYQAESFGLVAVEALAFGIPPVTSDWRMLPEIMAEAGLPVCRTGDPESLADGLLTALGRDQPEQLRAVFLAHFTAKIHLQHLLEAIKHPPDID
jgi:glycosyltransferase involved in cell wall biosynthesis